MQIAEDLGRTIVRYDGYYGIPQDNKRAHINYLDMRERLEKALTSRYPYLKFRVWNTPWKTEYQDRHPLGDTRTEVWAAGVVTSLKFSWPITSEVKRELDELNKQAELASQGGFLCSRCRMAYEKDEMAHARPGYVLCADCVAEGAI